MWIGAGNAGRAAFEIGKRGEVTTGRGPDTLPDPMRPPRPSLRPSYRATRRPTAASLVATALALVVLTAGGCNPAPAPEAAPPSLQAAASGWNVVILSVDTLRADRLNSYGYTTRETTPNIDALLAEGIRFENAMAPRSITWPSLATMLTGLYPSGHGIIENGYSFPDALPTLPKALHAAGYSTTAILSNMCQANHQGWDSFQCSQGRDGKTVDWVLDWSAAADRQRPFLLWVHLFGAHSPYYNGGDLAARELDPDYGGTLEAKKWRLDAVMEQQEKLDEADRRRLDAIYDAAVIGSDRLVGRIVEGLRQQGRLERTIFVFLADHGEELYQHNGYLYHACSVYQSTLHVPMGFVAPGLWPAGTVAQAIEMGDVTPTLLDLLGVQPLPKTHGVSIRPYLERPERGGEGKPAYSEYGDTRIHTVLAGDWKLISNPDALTPICFAGGPPDLYPIEPVELYDLSTDPLEENDLAAREPARVAALEALLRQRFADLADADLEGKVERQDLPEELKKELRSLGYVAN